MKYKVAICETTNNWYEVEIEADSIEDATEKAVWVDLVEPISIETTELWTGVPEEINE